MTTSDILTLLPYEKPFLFVDHLEIINENGVTGFYTYPTDSFFYRGHFKDFPVTPGVILTETMAQIGVVCLGIYLAKDQIESNAFSGIAMTSSEVEYLLPVFPEETVKVVSEKIYFRFGKLKCSCNMLNEKDELVCKGTIAGMMRRN